MYGRWCVAAAVQCAHATQQAEIIMRPDNSLSERMALADVERTAKRIASLGDNGLQLCKQRLERALAFNKVAVSSEILSRFATKNRSNAEGPLLMSHQVS